MKARLLPRAEWPRLNGTEAEMLWPLLSNAARVIVVEHDGEIVGCETFQPVLHGEGLWIHPDHRKHTAVARHLWKAMRETVKTEFGVTHFATGAASDEVRQLLQHAGATPLPDHFMVPVGD